MKMHVVPSLLLTFKVLKNAHAAKDETGLRAGRAVAEERRLMNVFSHTVTYTAATNVKYAKSKSAKSHKSKKTKCKTPKSGKKGKSKAKKSSKSHREDECEDDPQPENYTPSPTTRPTKSPTTFPTKTPTTSPTTFPTKTPTTSPTTFPTKSPSMSPTMSSSNPTLSLFPSVAPSSLPTAYNCSSEAAREKDVKSILEPIIGPSCCDDLSLEEFFALMWVFSDVISNTCNDTGATIKERYTLALMYFSLGGDEWENASNWMGSEHHCTSWYGVSCDSENRVDEISMNVNGLSGTIPEAIGMLENLCVLKLYANDITGTVPNALFNFTKLSFLDIEQNSLTGDFFSNPNLFNATVLEVLRISDNDFNQTSIPTEIGQLTNLKQLWIAESSLAGSLPEEFTNLVHLEDLIAYNNTLTGQIPDDIGKIANLTRLDMSENLFAGTLPAAIGTLLNMEILILSENRIKGSIAPEFGNLIDASEILLANNLLGGVLPAEFAFLINLSALDLEGNNIAGTIPDVSAWENLVYVNLSENGFNGTISESLFELEFLEVVYFSNNTLSGTIPANYGNALFLRDLWLNGNELTGTIPDVPTGGLTNITEILFDRNRLSGVVPNSLCDIRYEFLTNASLFETLHADCYPSPEGGDEPNNPCPEGCCTECGYGNP